MATHPKPAIQTPRVAIIGAGMAGVAAARRLQGFGIQPVLFEKSRGFGGRCATKRWQDCRIDHGAQYFTLRDPAFAAAVNAACGSAIARIETPVLNALGVPLPDSGRYYHRDGNSRLIRDLATGLEVRLETPVTEISRDASGWSVAGQSFDTVISSAPLPQTLHLIGQTPDHQPFIPCLALLLRYRGDWPGLTRSRYAVKDDASDTLAWSACENHKAGRVPDGCVCIVAHAAEIFSRRYLEHPTEDWVPLLRAEVESLWELSPDDYLAQHPHRWCYARVAAAITPPALPQGLFHASDALTASRVESAWLAGLQAADQLAKAHGLEDCSPQADGSVR